MKKPGPKVRSQRRLHREAGEFQYRSVRVERSSVRVKDRYCLSDCINNLTELHFFLSKLLFSSLALFDVSARSVPANDLAGFVAQWLYPNEKPTKHSIMPSEPRLDLA